MGDSRAAPTRARRALLPIAARSIHHEKPHPLAGLHGFEHSSRRRRAAAVARLLGFDLCPRLRELAQRRLFLPRGAMVPDELAKVCSAHVDTKAIEAHWDSLVHLAASVMSGQASAVTVMARLGSAARGDMLYDAGVQLGKLLRTAFLTDYFVNEGFRRELRRVLNRGEAVNALKRHLFWTRQSDAGTSLR